MSGERAEATRVQGVLISLEGVDGSGKSTQIALLKEALEAEGLSTVCVREPGGTPISEKIRALVLDPANPEMSPECELLLYEASRAQLVQELMVPALAQGSVVLCDRFYDSTTAYQAYGRDLDRTQVEQANALGSCGLVPELTIILDIDSAEALRRATREKADRMEEGGNQLMLRVAEGYRALAASGEERFHLLDARTTPQEIHEHIMELVEPLLTEHGIAGKA
ncbi:MAG: dTMP kinase [Atopobiaceae bacterium]|nr:dTMP kinase [Atopobiaceae bacterium]